MRLRALLLLLLLASGCTATRVVRLDTGPGETRVYEPLHSAPLQIDAAEFKLAVSWLVLDLGLSKGLSRPRDAARRSLLASVGGGGVFNEVQDHPEPSLPAENCSRQDAVSGCLSLLDDEFKSGLTQRRMMALSFALDTVWEGVGEALDGLADPAALRAIVVSMIGTTFTLLVAPEPITKFVAVALTASLIAYLGTGPVWNLGQGFLRLMEEAENAQNLAEVRGAGHRFGKTLGANGARVLVIATLTVLGGRNAMAGPGVKTPSFARAMSRAEMEGGFQLSAALAGEVHSIAVPSAGVLNIVLAPTAVAAVAMGPGNSIQGEPDGDIHHICTDKNTVSEASGGPWTPQFEKLFERAGLKLSDLVNQVRITGHRGPHPRAYHEEVLRRLNVAMKGCRGQQQCGVVLSQELASIARDLLREGSKLRNLITKDSQG